MNSTLVSQLDLSFYLEMGGVRNRYRSCRYHVRKDRKEVNRVYWFESIRKYFETIIQSHFYKWKLTICFILLFVTVGHHVERPYNETYALKFFSVYIHICIVVRYYICYYSWNRNLQNPQTLRNHMRNFRLYSHRVTMKLFKSTKYSYIP